MAGFLSMLRARGAPRLPAGALRRHLDALAARRGSPPWFDRLEPARIPMPGRPSASLHLDRIPAVGAPRGTVVFVPGTNAYAALYGEFLTALADLGLNVVGLDPRGHGRSDGARGSYVLTDILDDAAAAVRFARSHFGGPVVVAGSSQGGIASFYLAARGDVPLAGALCHNLADLDDSASAQCMRHPRLGRALRPWLSSALNRVPLVVSELPVPMSAYLDLTREPVRGADSAAAILASDPLTVPFVRLRGLASLSGGPVPQPCARIRVPLLVLHAGDDTIFPEAYVRSVVGRTRSAGGDVELRVYPGLAHYMVADDVPAFLPDVDAWLTRVLSSAVAEHAR